MTLLKRFIPLVVAVLLSACLELPEVGPESPPDAGVPDGGPKPPDGGPPADTTPPTITAASPAHNSTNVATSPQFQFTFSEPMNVGTVQVSIAPTVELTSPTWGSGNTQVTLQPTVALAQNTTYTLAVEGKDVAGNALTDRKLFSFVTTGPAPDTTRPTILAVSPVHGAIGVAQNATITVTFSEPMDKASAQSAFAITSPTGFNTGVFDWNAAGTEMSFNPDTDFPHGTNVEWRVSTAAKDLSDNTLERDVSGTFRAVRAATVTLDFDPFTSGSAIAPNYIRYGAFYNFELVGDTNENTQARLLLGFKLNALPDDLTRITNSKLKWFVTGQQDTPLADLGRLLLERVYIGESIAFSSVETNNPASKSQYEAASPSPPIVVSSNAINAAVVILDTTAFVVLDWSERTNRNAKRAQFRLRFETPSDNDGLIDRIYSDVQETPKLAELEITYEYP